MGSSVMMEQATRILVSPQESGAGWRTPQGADAGTWRYRGEGTRRQTWQTADSAQASKYFGRYRLVLSTNYRDFRLIGGDTDGKAVELEKYTFGKDAIKFWGMTAKPSPAAHQHAIHFEEFIRRVMMTAAPLLEPEDIAWFLASYAKDALATLNEKDASNLEPLRQALETALGIKFPGKEGDHFFKSTLIQTLFYGVFPHGLCM